MWCGLSGCAKRINAGLTSLVSSHNDSIPSNILFDGETALDDRLGVGLSQRSLVDVAIVLDSLVRSRELEERSAAGVAGPQA